LKSAVTFHADHMPPIAVVKQMNSRLWRKICHITVKQRFYPQCIKCSSKQGSILSKAVSELKYNPNVNLFMSGARDLSCFHGMRSRFFHLTGAVIGTITIYNAKTQDILNGSYKRFEWIHEQISNYFLEPLSAFVLNNIQS